MDTERYQRRILVIGAGAAGLSAAHYLKRKGYQDVTILEASSRVGGKCLSVQHQGRAYDLGAVIATMGYSVVHELAQAYDVPMVAGPRMLLVDMTGARIARLGNPSLRTWAHVASAWRFLRAWYRHRKLYSAGFRELSAGLEQDIAPWLASHDMAAMAEMVAPPFTGFGYGHIDRVPAAYLLKLMYLSFPRSLSELGSRLWKHLRINGLRQLGKVMDPLCFDDGYESLMTHMAAQLHPVLDTPVAAMRRVGGRMEVEYGDKREVFDAVISSVSPRILSALLTDLSNEDAHLLGLALTLDYHSLLLELESPPPHEGWFLRDNIEDPSRIGRPMVFAQAQANSPFCICYAFAAPGMSEAELLQNVEQDANLLGLGFRRVLNHETWEYSPHLPAEHMHPFYSAMERKQGESGLYVVGEVVSFTTVEHVAAYSKALVGRFF